MFARRLEAGKCGGSGQRTGGIDTGRTAAGRPVRSIRKNNVLPGSGPTDLHYGKNGYVPSSHLWPHLIYSTTESSTGHEGTFGMTRYT